MLPEAACAIACRPWLLLLTRLSAPVCCREPWPPLPSCVPPAAKKDLGRVAEKGFGKGADAYARVTDYGRFQTHAKDFVDLLR